jgi:hypothetical protein
MHNIADQMSQIGLQCWVLGTSNRVFILYKLNQSSKAEGGEEEKAWNLVIGFHERTAQAHSQLAPETCRNLCSMAPHRTLPSNLLETLHVSANLQTLAPSADWKPNLAL